MIRAAAAAATVATPEAKAAQAAPYISMERTVAVRVEVPEELLNLLAGKMNIRRTQCAIEFFRCDGHAGRMGHLRAHMTRCQ